MLKLRSSNFKFYIVIFNFPAGGGCALGADFYILN